MDAADIVSYFFCAAQAAIQLFWLRRMLSRKPDILLVLLFSAVNFASITLPIPFFIGLTGSVASVVLCCRFALCGNWSEAFLYGVLSSEIIWLSYGIFDSLLSLAGGLTNAFKTPFAGMALLVIGNVLSFAAYCLILSAAHKIIKNERADLRNIMIILVPLLLVFVVEVYIVRVLYSAAETRSGIERDIELLLIQGLGIASVFCVLSAYEKCADNFRMGEKIRLYDRERRYSKQYANEVKAYYDAARSLRHDFKNHILIIGELLQKERYQNAADYVLKLNELSESTEIKFHTGCPILDIILTDKLSGLADKVTIKCEAVPEIDETDICVIFANAVDNAVCAVSKLPDNERFIRITTKSRGELLFIELENSFDGEPFEFGTGIENIISAAEKYGGTARISSDGNTFSLKLILCNSRHQTRISHQNA